MPNRIRLVLAAALALALPLHAQPANPLITVDASAPIPAPETGYLHMGGVSPTGHSIQINSRYLTLDGKPWLPVMGEMHYTRVPEAEWESEILKMKAGGINIVSTYIFWIHHEEIEGTFDWSGRRDLRRFVQLCAKHGMYVYLRPGPWAHGEVRNGGFPDWLMKLPKLRTTDPDYIAHVATFYNQIGKQVQGLMFQQGGPVIGTQLENEYGQHGAGRGAEYILKLKQLAIAAGINPPLFSVTGWPSLDFPPNEVVPMAGGYPDGFWYTSKTNLPPSVTYNFNFHRELGDMGANLKNENADGKVDLKHYPYFAAEEAGGMAIAYHRRPLMSADDIAAVTLAGIGSGVNLYGYYMYHGGTNPAGKLSTLQESRGTNYPNDLPQIDYDFQAPIGAFGEIRDSYRKTRLVHLFLNAFGTQLAPMPAYEPKNGTSVKVAVRTDGKSGFVFYNNYVRQTNHDAQQGIDVQIKLPGGVVSVPDQSIPDHFSDNVPANSYFILPFNLALGAAKLQTATAQLLTRIAAHDGPLTVFFAIPGIKPIFVFDGTTVQDVHLSNTTGTVDRAAKKVMVTGLTPGQDARIDLTDSTGAHSSILLLTEQLAEHATVLQIGGRDTLALSSSDLFLDASGPAARLHLLSFQPTGQRILLFPKLAVDDASGGGPAVGGNATTVSNSGLWTDVSITHPERGLTVTATPTRTAAPRPEMKMGEIAPGKKGPAFPLLPDDAAFAQAAAWDIKIGPVDTHGLANAFLVMTYSGDIARLRSGETLLDDNFFYGNTFTVGLKQIAPGMFDTRPAVAAAGLPLSLEVVPMPADPPIYLDERARAVLKYYNPSPQLPLVQLLPQYESVLNLSPIADAPGKPKAGPKPGR